MTSLAKLKKQLLKDPAVRKEYEALEEEFALMAEVAKARARAGLSLRYPPSWRLQRRRARR